LHTCPLRTPVLNIAQLEAADPPVLLCSDSHNCSLQPLENCSALADCSICSQVDPANSTQMLSVCTYSPALDVCILAHNGTSSYQLVGLGSCAYRIDNFTAQAEENQARALLIQQPPVQVIANGSCLLCTKPTGIDTTLFALPSTTIVDQPLPPLQPPSEQLCDNRRRLECAFQTIEANCSALPACLWCPNSFPGLRAPGRCRFAPPGDTCTLRGQAFPRTCSQTCSTVEMSCMLNLDAATCHGHTAAKTLKLWNAATTVPCSWCNTSQVCYASRRCYLGGVVSEAHQKQDNACVTLECCSA
jgi:hypothetical protein